MILVIDNYDSFTFNLVQLIGSRAPHGTEIKVIRNDALEPSVVAQLAATHVVLSPGPGHPRDSNLSLHASRLLPSTPILGVCLGHQALALCYGARVERTSAPTHGRTVPVLHDGSPPMTGVGSPFDAALYHSLSVVRDSMPPELLVTATSPDGTIMAIRHRDRLHFGVQFHPESFMTNAGPQLLAAFLNLP